MSKSSGTTFLIALRCAIIPAVASAKSEFEGIEYAPASVTVLEVAFATAQHSGIEAVSEWCSSGVLGAPLSPWFSVQFTVGLDTLIFSNLDAMRKPVREILPKRMFL